MVTREYAEVDVAWGRVLIGIGVIIAVLALGALEVLTARFPVDVPHVGQGDIDDGGARQGQDALDMRARFARHDPGAVAVDEGNATEPTAGRQPE